MCNQVHNAWKLLKVRLYQVSLGYMCFADISIVNSEAYAHVYHLVIVMLIVMEFFCHIKFPHMLSFGQLVMFLISVNVYTVRVKIFSG